MGRKRKRKGSGAKNNERRVMKRRQTFWIRDCEGADPSIAEYRNSNQLTVWITYSELDDDHHSKGRRGTKQDSASTLNPSSNTTLGTTGGRKDTSVTFAVDEVATDTAGSRTMSTAEKKTLEQTNVVVIRTESSRKRVSLPPYYSSNYKPLPHGDCGDGIRNPFPDQVPDRYWAQRKRYFSKFDEGIVMGDSESWYSVTPEAIADHTARKMVDKSLQHKTTFSEENSKVDPKLTIVDCFGGIGGNTLAFARLDHVENVVCVDICAEKLKAAANNCRVYDIPSSKVVLIQADACLVMKSYVQGCLSRNDQGLENASSGAVEEASGYRMGGISLLPDHIDAIFLSPPWGGIDYGQRKYFCLSDIQLDNGCDGEQVLCLARNAVPPGCHNIAYFLPDRTDGATVGEDAHRIGFRGNMEIEANFLNGKLKTVTAYFGSEQGPST